MKTLPTRSNARVSEVARFLGMEARDVRRMMRFDGLPAVKVPGPTKPLFRIPLRAFREWLAAREVNGGISLSGSFEEFCADFHRAAGSVGNEEGGSAA
jgi:hypothetical protein